MFAQIINGHRFLISDSIKDYIKLQDGPLCLLFRALNKAKIRSISYEDIIRMYNTGLRLKNSQELGALVA